MPAGSRGTICLSQEDQMEIAAKPGFAKRAFKYWKIGRGKSVAPFFGAMLLAATASAAEDGPSFLREMHAAMDRMTASMHARPTGDVDIDFVAMMEPHHKAAIDMAVAELRYGKNEQLRRLAQEIIVDQQQEIAAMHMALGRPLPATAPVPTVPGPSTAQHQHHKERAE